MKILEWLDQSSGIGESSKAIAMTALGAMPKNPNYPHDGDDFGRCFRLLASCPDAIAGLNELGRAGGEIWQALVPRWKEIEAAYLYDLDLHEKGERDNKKYKCYDLMKSIIHPIEDKSRTVFRGKGFSISLK